MIKCFKCKTINILEAHKSKIHKWPLIPCVCVCARKWERERLSQGTHEPPRECAVWLPVAHHGSSWTSNKQACYHKGLPLLCSLARCAVKSRCSVGNGFQFRLSPTLISNPHLPQKALVNMFTWLNYTELKRFIVCQSRHWTRITTDPGFLYIHNIPYISLIFTA